MGTAWMLQPACHQENSDEQAMAYWPSSRSCFLMFQWEPAQRTPTQLENHQQVLSGHDAALPPARESRGENYPPPWRHCTAPSSPISPCQEALDCRWPICAHPASHPAAHLTCAHTHLNTHAITTSTRFTSFVPRSRLQCVLPSQVQLLRAVVLYVWSIRRITDCCMQMSLWKYFNTLCTM